MKQEKTVLLCVKEDRYLLLNDEEEKKLCQVDRVPISVATVFMRCK